MTRTLAMLTGLVALALGLAGPEAAALSRERWTDPTPYGVFFNEYDANFYTGFAPRVQDKRRITMHVARGNQLRVRMVLPDAALDSYLSDQVARHDLYRELIEKGIIVLTANKAWEDYQERFEAEGFRGLAAKKTSLSPEEWRALNVRTIDKLHPERLYRIQKDFGQLATAWAALLKSSPAPTDLEARLELVNALFPHRTFAYRLSDAEDAALTELIALAKADDRAVFGPKAAAFFTSITDGVYDLHDGKIDYYEYTAIYPAGSHDATTTHDGRAIPVISTPGVWPLIPRAYGQGMTGMVDYISSRGYYGMLPMLPYEHGGGILYNSIHNTGISNWIQGHPLLPKAWASYSAGSRSGRPYNRVAITSRGPVSHGCTRLNTGHLAELREMLPSTSAEMEGIVTYRNPSHCYDVFDRKGDGKLEIMGTQYYLAFRHNKSRVATQIWAQNTRKDFYEWLYGNEMSYGPIGQVTFDRVCEGKFVGKQAREGKTYQGLTLYEAPYVPDAIQFYKIKGVSTTSTQGYNFNRELRRVGYGYTVNRKTLLLD
ncbi:MAG: hypothetical protein ACREXK_01205 [Gammaproteobacteria bacterium]